MLNLSKIQLELERAKEKLRNVEETIQKVEGKTFSNGPIWYGGPKADYNSEKTRNVAPLEDVKNPRRRVIASAVDARIQRLPTEDSPFGLKRGVREKREPALGFKRQSGDARPQGVFARLSGAIFHQADEEDDDDFGKKPTLPSRVYTTAAEVPSRQEVIAAQAQDEQSKGRNKRMFGALVGTLQKFRKEETRVREREEKRMKVEKKLEEDAQREKEKLMQEKRELFLEKKRREVEIKRIEWSLNRVKEYEAWEANVLPLKNFIQTQAKPHIFYLPCEHNTKTQDRLAHSQKLVERMIEKRKTNLKEEIENSEKKARKVAAEDVEEEEAENIPEDNDGGTNAEKPIQIDFESKNKENGFFEGEKKNQTGSPDNLDKDKEIIEKTENWNIAQEESEKKELPEPVLENEKKISASDKEELSITDCKDSNNDSNSISEERLDDRVGEDFLGKSEQEIEKKMCETGEREEIKSETNEANAEKRACESQEDNSKVEVPSGQTENIEKIVDQKPNSTDFTESIDNNKEPDSEQATDKKLLLSESEPKTEDSSKQCLESQKEKIKTEESSLRRDKSQSRKNSRRSRSAKRSRSPSSSLKNKRRRSSSRQRVSRRQSCSSSPRKSRRSRSPLPRRGQRNFSSRKRSPLTKSRRRKSSSRSSSSVSPRKKRSRSAASSRSKSD